MSGLHYAVIWPKLRATLLALTLCTAAAAWGCQVPVFRYALERWEPGTYRLLMPAATQIQLPQEPVNVTVETAAHEEKMELLYPLNRHGSSDKPIWSAPANDDQAAKLWDSPIRRELKRRLLAGHSAVWLLLECGNATQDDAAARTLDEALQSAQQQLRLPEGVMTREEANDPKRRRENADVLQSDLPLRIEFSILRLSRQDDREAALIAMLTHMEPDLGEYETEPMVFPVFGRGRALEPLIGKGIHAGNILEASSYLCGACSCEIKEQNPGVDLLMAADWSAVAGKEVVETVTIKPRVVEDGPAKPIGWIAGGVVLALVGYGFLAGRIRR